MHATDRVGVYWKRQVLMNPRLFPPKPFGIRVGARKRSDSFLLAQSPFSFAKLLHLDQGGSPPIGAIGVIDSPAAHMMGTSGHPRSYSFRDPQPYDEMTDFSSYPDEIAVLEIASRCVQRVNPQRICVGDFIKPFGVCRSCVNERWEPERRHEQEVARVQVEVPPVNVTLNVVRYRMFGPFPIAHRF